MRYRHRSRRGTAVRARDGGFRKNPPGRRFVGGDRSWFIVAAGGKESCRIPLTPCQGKFSKVASLHALPELLVLQADLVDKLSVERDLLPQRDGPRLRVSLRVIHRHSDFQVPVVGPADSF